MRDFPLLEKQYYKEFSEEFLTLLKRNDGG